jgi:hypothetical protein
VVLLKDPTRAAIAKAARESRDSEPNPWRNRAETIAAIIAKPDVRNLVYAANSGTEIGTASEYRKLQSYGITQWCFREYFRCIECGLRGLGT